MTTLSSTAEIVLQSENYSSRLKTIVNDELGMRLLSDRGLLRLTFSSDLDYLGFRIRQEDVVAKVDYCWMKYAFGEKNGCLLLVYEYRNFEELEAAFEDVVEYYSALNTESPKTANEIDGMIKKINKYFRDEYVLDQIGLGEFFGTGHDYLFNGFDVVNEKTMADLFKTISENYSGMTYDQLFKDMPKLLDYIPKTIDVNVVRDPDNLRAIARTRPSLLAGTIDVNRLVAVGIDPSDTIDAIL